MNQSAPTLIKMYMTIRSEMSSIMGSIGLEQQELFALELGKNAEFGFDSYLFTLQYISTILTNQHQTW